MRGRGPAWRGGAGPRRPRPRRRADRRSRRCRRARVVDDQDPPAVRQICAHGGDDRLDVGGFVVGRDHYPGLARRADPGNLDEGLNRPDAPSIQTMPLRNAEIADALIELGDALRARRGEPLPRDRLSGGGAGDPPEPGLGRGAGARGQGDRAPRGRRHVAGEDRRALETGEIPAAAKLKAKFPASLIEVTRIPGLGAKTVRRLYDELGVSSASTSCAPLPRASGSAGSRASARRPRRTCSPRSAQLGERGPAGAPAALGRAPDRRGARRRPAGPLRPATRSRSPARRGDAPRPARTST